MLGRGPTAFAARVAALRERPDLWGAFPGGVMLDARDYRDLLGVRQAWIRVVDYLQARGLVSPATIPIDINVPRLVEACREGVSA